MKKIILLLPIVYLFLSICVNGINTANLQPNMIKKNPNHYYAEQWYRVSGVCYDENGEPNKYLNEKVTDATRTSDNPVIFLSKEIFELGKLEQQTENNYFYTCAYWDRDNNVCKQATTDYDDAIKYASEIDSIFTSDKLETYTISDCYDAYEDLTTKNGYSFFLVMSNAKWNLFPEKIKYINYYEEDCLPDECWTFAFSEYINNKLCLENVPVIISQSYTTNYNGNSIDFVVATNIVDIDNIRRYEPASSGDYDYINSGSAYSLSGIFINKKLVKIIGEYSNDVIKSLSINDDSGKTGGYFYYLPVANADKKYIILYDTEKHEKCYTLFFQDIYPYGHFPNSTNSVLFMDIDGNTIPEIILTEQIQQKTVTNVYKITNGGEIEFDYTIKTDFLNNRFFPIEYYKK